MSRVLFHLCSDLQNSQNGIYLSIVFTFFTSFHLWNHPFHLLYIYTAFLQLIITTAAKSLDYQIIHEIRRDPSQSTRQCSDAISRKMKFSPVSRVREVHRRRKCVRSARAGVLRYTIRRTGKHGLVSHPCL